jgi:thiol-disulfide isomerase/thioredoxin
MRRVLLVGLLISAFTVQAQYKLNFKVDGLKDTTVYLLKYLGDKLYYADTTEAKDGKATFSKDDYDGGVYAFYTGEGYFEFIMSDQDKVVNLETSTENFIKYMNVKQSAENQVFFQYVKFIAEMKGKSQKLAEERNALDEEKDKKRIDEINEKLKAMDQEVKQFQKDLAAEHEGKLVAKFLKMSIDIEIPEGLNDTLQGEYLREHYWDNTDLTDPRLARSPVFGNKVDFYFQKMMHQIPDTIVRHASLMVDQIQDSTDMMKFVLNYVHVNYETSNIMGMDAVYVKMSLKYYCGPNGNKAWWYPEENLKDRCEKAQAWENLIIGATAPNLRLADPSEKNWIDVHQLPNEYKVMIFWDPDCGHCKKELPKLLKLYRELKEKELDVEFIGIGTNLENEKWADFIKEKELEWINISDFPDANKNAGKYVYEMRVTDYPSLNFRKTYDIFSTPQIYLLDKDNVIIGKRLDANNLARILERRLDTTIDYKEEPKEEKPEGPANH